MAYTVTLIRTASKQFRKLPPAVQRRIGAAFDDLSENPRPAGHKKLAGPEGFLCIRVGDYRIVYQVDDNGAVLEVLGCQDRPPPRRVPLPEGLK